MKLTSAQNRNAWSPPSTPPMSSWCITRNSVSFTDQYIPIQISLVCMKYFRAINRSPFLKSRAVVCVALHAIPRCVILPEEVYLVGPSRRIQQFGAGSGFPRQCPMSCDCWMLIPHPRSHEVLHKAHIGRSVKGCQVPDRGESPHWPFSAPNHHLRPTCPLQLTSLYTYGPEVK